MLPISQILPTFCRKMLKPWQTLAADTDSNRHSLCDIRAAAKLVLVQADCPKGKL